MLSNCQSVKNFMEMAFLWPKPPLLLTGHLRIYFEKQYRTATSRKARSRSHTSSVFLRALGMFRRQPAVRRNSTLHERGVVAPHSVDTETSRRQFSYHPVQAQTYVIFFSTSTRALEINYFRTDLTFGFKNGTFACVFQSLNSSSFSMLDICIHNGLVTRIIESSSTKFEIHTIKLFSRCAVVEWRSTLHRHCFC
jgi:hypothetical protein